MYRIAILIGCCLLAASVLAHAGDGEARVFLGEISDSQCALNIHSLTRSHQEMLKSKSMGGTAKECADYCVKYLGGVLVLSSKQDVYRLSNPERVVEFTGQQVRITGTLESKTKTIHVLKIEAVK
jgi:Protein of unknown function (DUF5818)